MATSAGKNSTSKKKSTSSNKKTAGTKSTTTKKASAKSTSGKSRKKTASKKKSSGAGLSRTRDRYESPIKKEIVGIAIAFVSVFLFCSMIGICGKLGDIIRTFFRGIFGIAAYAIPFAIIGITLYLIFTENRVRAACRIGIGAVLLSVLCAIAELVGQHFVGTDLAWDDFYVLGGIETLTGGVFGGMWVKLFYPHAGLFGTYLIVSVIGIVCILVLSQKSLLGPIKDSLEQVKQRAQDSRELRDQEKELRRSEREEKEERRRKRAYEERSKRLEEESEQRRIAQEEKEKRQEEQRILNAQAAKEREESRLLQKEQKAKERETQKAERAEQARLANEQKEAERARRSQAEAEEAAKQSYRMNNTVRGIDDIRIGEDATPQKEEKKLETDAIGVIGSRYNVKLNTGEPVTEGEIEFTGTTAKKPAGISEEEKAAWTAYAENLNGTAPKKPEVAPVIDHTPEIVAAATAATASAAVAETKTAADGVLRAGREVRTDAELAATDPVSLDVLHPVFSRVPRENVPDILHQPNDKFTGTSADGTPMDEELPVIEPLRSKLTDAAPVETEYERMMKHAAGRSETAIKAPEATVADDRELTAAEVFKPREEAPVSVAPEVPPVEDINGRRNDTMRVVSATGRVIEADNDPTEDPIRQKLGKLSEAALTVDAAAKAEEEIYPVDILAGPKKSAAQGWAEEIADGEYLASSEKSNFISNPPVIKKKEYEKPSLSILTKPKSRDGGNDEELDQTAAKLIQTLKEFGVGASILGYSRGPSVTRYELKPDQGVKVSRFLSLSDDIKLSLAAADIRMEAPIPGMSAIGIEVPNKTRAGVGLREVLEGEKFMNSPSRLTIGVGKDISGNNIVHDLAKMPHLLVAGTTGSGKSVFVNTMIVSILYKATPDEVKFIMIDPKMVEFGIYNGIPHLLTPVVTDSKKASEVLKWAVLQMTDRYKKFAEKNVRDIKGYNEKIAKEAGNGKKAPAMYQIVIIVDELSDLMMVAANEVEDSIVRLAQMARAAGIHLILATQRPTVNVVTGLIKANVPSRVALSVANGMDSRTIIDMNGAEKLLGNGDMLFYPSGYQKPLRVQGAFVSDNEINDLVDFLRGQGEADFDADLEKRMNASESGGSEDGGERDELFEKAGKFIVETKKASIGNLQRMFKIGFNRAARIMDQLADAGVVGPDEGTKARKINMTPAEFDEWIHS